MNTFLKPGLRRTVGMTALCNVVAMASSALAGVMVARFLGPTVRGEYAAVAAWFGAALVLGELGQPAAICYYVARDPRRARHYVAAARNLMLGTGLIVALIGIVIAPVLSHYHANLTFGYRLMFAACPLCFVGASYLFALQGRAVHHWLFARAIQPVTYLLLVAALKVGSSLTLDHVLEALVASFALQAAVSQRLCRAMGLASGHGRRSLTNRLTRYGFSQILASTPSAVNTQLDQLVLSQTVVAATLGRYAIAVSLTSLAYPLVSPIGSVLFPKLAADRANSTSDRILQKKAMVVSAAVSSVVMVTVALGAHWVVPAVFGPDYRGATILVWILAPGGIFYACNQVGGDLLRGRHQPSAAAWAQGAGALATIVLLGTLVPFFGVTGAAVASSFSYAVTMLVICWSLFKKPATVSLGVSA